MLAAKFMFLIKILGIELFYDIMQLLFFHPQLPNRSEYKQFIVK